MISFTHVVLVLFCAYVLNCGYVLYSLFNPEDCKKSEKYCIKPAYQMKDLAAFKVSLYASHSASARLADMDLIWDSKDSSILKNQDITVNITLPFSTRRNGSLYAYVFIHPKDQGPFDRNNDKATYQQHKLSRYAIPKDMVFNLIQGNKEKVDSKPVTHMHQKISIYVAIQNVKFHQYKIPGDIYHLLQFNKDGHYHPLLYIDELSTLRRNLMLVSRNTTELPLKIYFTPVSLGRLRIWSTVEQTLGKMTELGFTENDLDDIKGLFTDTDLYFLGMTFAIALLHMLFDVLAFKNDVNFWREKESMEGMSTRTVIWRCISTTIIFLYLMDQKTSLLVLVPAGIGAIIEFWKVTKALKIEVDWSTRMPKVKFGQKSKSEQETAEFDEQAMKYLSYALYPLLAAASIYSLIYQPHKSWYSWVVRSLVNGVYAFGFLFMLPQLFVNYKLKSVAHLPWRAFMYKAFNTFIDDVFAFIITMPTAHRVACFRDDAVFLVYLYQRWLYPVDKSRTNEYGMTFEERKEETKKTQ